MFLENINIEKLDQCIEANNAKLLEGKQVLPFEVKDRTTGEVLYTRNYIAESWTIEKVKGARSSFYRLSKSIKNNMGKSIDIQIPLTDDDMEYLLYYKGNALQELQTKGKQTVSLKTRFMYGHTDTNNFYVGVFLLISERIQKNRFLPDTKVDIILDSMCDERTQFNIVLEKKAAAEEINIEDLNLL